MVVNNVLPDILKRGHRHFEMTIAKPCARPVVIVWRVRLRVPVLRYAPVHKVDTAPKVPVPMRVDAMLVLFVTKIRSMVKDVPNRGMNPVNAKRVTFVLLAVIQPNNGSAKRVIIVHEVQPRRSNVPTMPKNVLVNIVWLGSPCRKTFLMDFVVSINRTVEVCVFIR
jgi:hypothetical protein